MNYKHFNWAAYAYPSLDCTDSIELGSAFQKNSDGSFSAVDQGGKTLTINDIHKRAANIRLEIYKENRMPLLVTMEIMDASHTQYYALPETDIAAHIPRSAYKNLHLSGELDRIRLNLNNVSNETFYIHNITLNAVPPVYFMPFRLFALFALLFIGCLARPASDLYQYKLDLKSARQKFVLGLLVLAQMTLFIKLGQFLPAPGDMIQTQYDELAAALLKGHFYLDAEPSPELIAMEDPYDRSQRALQEIPAKWDTAYYQGQYYCYFGVVPALLFYLPFHLITHNALSHGRVTLILSFFVILGILGLVHQICRRWFPNMPFLQYLFICVTFIEGCGALFYNAVVMTYNIPIFTAIGLSITGLYFWMSSASGSANPAGRPVQPAGEVAGAAGPRLGRLCAGSWCMALVSGARPLLLFASFLSWPIFAPFIRGYFTGVKKNAACRIILCFAAPFVLTGVFIMYYNYARFGSVFDFGQNYNLTVINHTKEEFQFGIIGYAIWTYLLQPAGISNLFPFIQAGIPPANYQGYLFFESYEGGVLINNLLLWFNFLPGRIRRWMIQEKAMLFCAACVLGSVCTAVFDAHFGGFIMRYTYEFTWPFFLSAIVIVCVLGKRLENTEKQKYLAAALAVCAGLGLFYNFAAVLDYGSVNAIRNTHAYMTLKYSIAFWL